MDFLRRLRPGHQNSDYQQLPTISANSSPSASLVAFDYFPSSWQSGSAESFQSQPILNRRLRRHAVAASVAFILVLVTARITVHHWSGLPQYSEIEEYEAQLPQHNLSLPFPEGRDGRFVKFNVPITHKGWNNVMEDIIMLSETARLANRGFVFPSYTWSNNPFTPVVPDDRWRPRSAVIPLNAFLSGPLAGGPIVNSTSPRAISEAWWEIVCPPSRRVYVDIPTTKRELGLDVAFPEGRDVFDRWQSKLGGMNETCVEVGGRNHIWSFGDGGSAHTISAWETLSTSPILSQFSWSPLVDSIAKANLPLLLTGVGSSDLLSDYSSLTLPNVMKGTLGVHLRAGDFVPHCKYLSAHGLDYAVWNSFDDYQDSIISRSPSDLYGKHCAPSVEEVIQRVREVKWDWEATDGGKRARHLNRIYIMTNAEPVFLAAVRRGLELDGWESVLTTRDLTFPPAAVEVDMAADMLIGQKAEVFLGNAFSTLTSNVNLLRRSNHSPPESTRFW